MFLKSFSKKIGCLQRELNTELTIKKSDGYRTVLVCYALPISEFQILLKSCSIECRNDPSSREKMEVVHETKFSLKNLLFNFIFCRNLLNHLDMNFVQKCQICVICENLD